MTACHQSDSLKQLAVNFSEHVTTTDAPNSNLPEPHKELLRWHYCLGHIDLRTIQFIMQTGALTTSQAMK